VAKSDELQEKRRPVKCRLIQREHAGKTVEVYRILEELIREHHSHLESARIALMFARGWKPDVDGHLKLGQIRKATDVNRELAAFDLVILLNETAFAGKTLSDNDRKRILDHELCHAALVRDTEAQPVYDERDRLVYRLRRNDIEEFDAIIQRYGKDLEMSRRAASKVIAAEQHPLFPDDQGSAGDKKLAEATPPPPTDGKRRRAKKPPA